MVSLLQTDLSWRVCFELTCLGESANLNWPVLVNLLYTDLSWWVCFILTCFGESALYWPVLVSLLTVTCSVFSGFLLFISNAYFIGVMSLYTNSTFCFLLKKKTELFSPSHIVIAYSSLNKSNISFEIFI